MLIRSRATRAPQTTGMSNSQSYLGGSRGQPREAWLAWNFQRELWFIYFFRRETWLGVPPWNVIGNLYSTWSVIKSPFSTWKRYKSPKIRVFKRYIINARYMTSLPWRRSLPLFIGGFPELSLMITCAGYMYYGYHGNAFQQWRRGETYFYELLMALYFF